MRVLRRSPGINRIHVLKIHKRKAPIIQHFSRSLQLMDVEEIPTVQSRRKPTLEWLRPEETNSGWCRTDLSVSLNTQTEGRWLMKTSERGQKILPQGSKSNRIIAKKMVRMRLRSKHVPEPSNTLVKKIVRRKQIKMQSSLLGKPTTDYSTDSQLLVVFIKMNDSSYECIIRPTYCYRLKKKKDKISFNCSIILNSSR